MEIPQTDQWKLEGNCGLCRREPHCNKPCSVHKRWMDKVMKQRLAETIPGKVAQTIGNSYFIDGMSLDGQQQRHHDVTYNSNSKRKRSYKEC